MAFTTTELKRGVIGDLNYVIVKGVSAGGSTGGDIPTGFKRVFWAGQTIQDSSVSGNAFVVNETFPLDSANVTVVTDANETVYVFAVGQA